MRRVLLSGRQDIYRREQQLELTSDFSFNREGMVPLRQFGVENNTMELDRETELLKQNGF